MGSNHVISANGRAPATDFDIKEQTFHDLSANVQRALFTFESTANQAVLRIYRRTAAIAGGGIFEEGGIGGGEGNTENALLTRGRSEETVFLVYQ